MESSRKQYISSARSAADMGPIATNLAVTAFRSTNINAVFAPIENRASVPKGTLAFLA
jgi:hypothetical protein